MKYNELRAACEKAGLDVKNDTGMGTDWWCVYVDHQRIWGTNPVLPPYVATLLLQKADVTWYSLTAVSVAAMGYPWECEVLERGVKSYFATGGTPQDAVINACMKVLS